MSDRNWVDKELQELADSTDIDEDEVDKELQELANNTKVCVDDLEILKQLNVNPSEDDISDELQLRGRFTEAIRGTEFQDCVVLPLSAVEFLTQPRIKELIKTIQEEDPESISHLAKLVDRGFGHVYDDVNELCSYDIITTKKNRYKTKPELKYTTVLFDPLYFDD